MKSTFDRFLDIRRNLPAADTLAKPYIEYCFDISPETMAISFEMATFVWLLCCDTQPQCLADFGSGFSSYVLRTWAALANPSATIVSVDDDEAWLDRTREFLERHDRNTDNLVMYEDWEADPSRWPRFDLALHDFSSGEKREQAMYAVANQMRPGGVLVFDDAMHEGHFLAMNDVCKQHGWTLGCLPETRDKFNRYGAMVVC